MAILMGLAAALCWGGTDFLGGSAARQLGVRRSLFFTQSIGFLAISLLVALSPEARVLMAGASADAWLWAIAAGAANFGGMLFLLTALAHGKAAIVAPIVASLGVVTTLLSVATGETLGGWAIAGLALCILGIPCIVYAPAGPDTERSSRTPIYFALLSALSFGVGFWLQGRYAVPQLGSLPTVWLLYALNILCLTALLIAEPSQFKLPPPTLRLLIVFIGLLSLGGFASMALGALTGAVSVVTVLSTLSGAVTAGLGVALRGERLGPIQWFGVIGVLCGVVLLRLEG